MGNGTFRSRKIKKNPHSFIFSTKVFLTFCEMGLSGPKIKNVLIVSQKKTFLIFWETELSKKLLSFRRIIKEIHSEKISYISINGTLKPKIKICYISGGNFKVPS